MQPDYSKKINETMNRIYQGGMTTASGGNISVRDEKGNIWTTPGGTDKGLLTAEDIVCIQKDGTVANEKGNSPTSELPSHRAIYREREDIHAVIHSHPPALVTYSIARLVPETKVHPRLYEICGEVGYAPYEISGSEELGQSIAGQFGNGHNCVVMENHAVVVGGKDLDEAYRRFENLELCAEAIIKANRIGAPKMVSEEKIRKFQNEREEAIPEKMDAETDTSWRMQRDDIGKLVRRCYSQGLMTSVLGSLSVRTRKNDFLVTPEEADRYKMSPESIVEIKEGTREKGKMPDREAGLHQRIYEAHEHVNCIGMIQSPNIMAFCVAGVSFDTRTIPESYVFLREIPMLPFESQFGGEDQIVAAISKETPLVLIENGGLIVTGRSPLEAFHRMEVAEFSAKSLIDTNSLGREVSLEVERLKELTRKFVR